MSEIMHAHEPAGPDGPDEPGGRIQPEARREIEALLSALRQWLVESEQWREPREGGAVDPAEFPTGGTNLHTLVGEWLALKQEIRLETRGSKAVREDLGQAVSKFQESASQLSGSARAMLEPLLHERDLLREDLDARQRAWLELLLDLRETFERAAASSTKTLDRLGWRRWFLPAGLTGGMREGYEWTLRRIDAALEAQGVQQIRCEGQRVDPLRMKVVDTVPRNDLPEGQVTDVVRHGYVSGGRVIRYAEVRAVRNGEHSEGGA